MKQFVLCTILIIATICLVSNVSGSWIIPPGGHTLSSVALDSSTNYLFVVIRGTDNHLYFNQLSLPRGWAGWTSIGGTTYDEPTLGVTLDGTVHVVIRGTDNGLYYKKLNVTTNTWDSTWTNLGGHTASAPTLMSSQSGNPDEFQYLWLAIRGTDNHVYLKQWEPAVGWEASWQNWGGTTNDRPALAFLYSMAPSGSTLTLGMRGTDNKVYVRDYGVGFGSTGFKGPWKAIGGSTLSPPVIGYKNGVLQIVVRGTDNHIYHKAGSNPYVALGGTTFDCPAAQVSSGSTLICIRGGDNRVYGNLNMSSGWSGWTNRERSTLSHPTISHYVLAIRGIDNGIYLDDYLV